VTYYVKSRSRKISFTIKRRKGNGVGSILLGKCLLKDIVERKIEGSV
jgi:hypothetical protein